MPRPAAPNPQFSSLHLHVHRRLATNLPGETELTIHLLTPETEANKNPHPKAIQWFPGFRSCGSFKIVVDDETSKEIVPGTKFKIAPSAP
jgi:hypothetical protein